jgi:hypothetical protein
VFDFEVALELLLPMIKNEYMFRDRMMNRFKYVRKFAYVFDVLVDEYPAFPPNYECFKIQEELLDDF